MKFNEKANLKQKWTIQRFKNDDAYRKGMSYLTTIFKRNVLLNEGIAEMWDLIIGAGGTAFNNANANIGVGDGTAAALATQTGLQGSNITYQGMEAGYPQRSGQTVTFRAVFDGAMGNHSWQEFTVANGNSDAAVNMNRRVDDQGTKASGQTWTIDLEITLS